MNTAVMTATYLLYVWVLGANPNFAPQLTGGFATQDACQAAGEAIKTTTLQTAYDSGKPGSKKLNFRYLCVASGQ
jgi:hypothetical protein